MVARGLVLKSSVVLINFPGLQDHLSVFSLYLLPCSTTSPKITVSFPFLNKFRIVWQPFVPCIPDCQGRMFLSSAFTHWTYFIGFCYKKDHGNKKQLRFLWSHWPRGDSKDHSNSEVWQPNCKLTRKWGGWNTFARHSSIWFFQYFMCMIVLPACMCATHVPDAHGS